MIGRYNGWIDHNRLHVPRLKVPLAVDLQEALDQIVGLCPHAHGHKEINNWHHDVFSFVMHVLCCLFGLVEHVLPTHPLLLEDIVEFVLVYWLKNQHRA